MIFDELSTFRNRLEDDIGLLDRLMQRRARNILFVAPLYDAYILQQEANLAEQILNEYKQLNLSTIPRVVTVPTGQHALDLLEENSFDLVLTSLRIGSVDPFELAEKLKESHPKLPVMLLLNSEADIPMVLNSKNRNLFKDVFLWTGDSKLFLAILKSVEDRLNADYDTREGFVRAILLVEDDISYYSRFLPLLYEEIVKQTQRVIGDEHTLGQKTLRMRARPKVLMAHDYEEAMYLYKKFKQSLLCVISDVRYPIEGRPNPIAGIKFVEVVKKEQPTLPVVLQSTDPRHWGKAYELGATFLHKHSDTLLKSLKEFLLNNCGFGDFIFRSRDGLTIDRATSISELAQKISSVPLESIVYHSHNNHFSAWLTAHGEIQLARRLRPMTEEDFASPKALRQYLIDLFRSLRRERTRGKIVDYHPRMPFVDNAILRLAPGSLGGKGRGLAFLNAFLSATGEHRADRNVRVRIPNTAIVGTDEFDAFLELNELPDLLNSDDETIKKAFVAGRLSPGMRGHLARYLEHTRNPIAVRSSSLLEDSQSRPFAGIYETFMLPNNHPDLRVRLEQLCIAVRLVFSSVFLSKAKSYIESIQYGVEQEKMAVVLQEIVGHAHGDHFYPDIAGVAESFDFYPPPGVEPGDGVASIGYGLGKYIVDGSTGVRFCPRHPTRSTRLADEMPARSQKQFYAISLKDQSFNLTKSGEDATLQTLSIKSAQDNDEMSSILSTWDVQCGELVPGNYCDGPKVVTFENILINTAFPLAELLDDYLRVGELALGVPVQLEFAVTLEDRTFHLLQIRPLARFSGTVSVDLNTVEKEKLLLRSDEAMGHGEITEVTDIIYVKPDKFDNLKTMEMKSIIGRMNKRCKEEETKFLLIGPGRWGTRDKFLGIPIQWSDITQVKAMVELGIPGFPVEPSQGTHFFHNLVAMNMGYFTIDETKDSGYLDKEWLSGLKVIEDEQYVLHLRAPQALSIKMDGSKRLAIVEKECPIPEEPPIPKM